MNERGTWEQDFKLEDALAEVDRLRAELAEERAKHTLTLQASDEQSLQIDRLRAEIAQFKHALEMQQHTEMGLRAKNAILEDALKMIVSSGYDESARVFAAEVAARAILAKTASRQPASDQEPQKSA